VTRPGRAAARQNSTMQLDTKRSEKMNGILWDEKEVQVGVNTAIAAAASERLINGTQRVDAYNKLLLVNRDSVDIRVYFSPADYTDVRAGGSLVVEPDEGKFFTSVTQENLDGSVAQTAGRITVRVAKAVRA